MVDKSVIPYDLVATKMNYWYVALKNDWVDKAEKMRSEVKQEIAIMEENQDVLIYFSLLEFRHKLMLDYLCPEAAKDIQVHYEELREKTKGGKSLNGMLEYYYYLFTAMYHFRQKEILHALAYYQNAENQLNSFESDEIEKAEFYFKLSEIYFYMKQTYFSMYYANHAYKIYLKQPTYGQRRVQCQFLMTGNWLDKMNPEKALEHTSKALSDAKELQVDYLIGSSHLNIGICYSQLEEHYKAENHFQMAAKLYKNEKHSFLPKALFNISHVKAKQEKWIEAEDLYFEGREWAQKFEDQEFLAKLKMIYGLYLSFDLDVVRESFQFFSEKGMYADIEEYGVITAELLQGKEMLNDSLEFYRRVVEARRQIQRSETVNES
ncbi:tetratricopeptide repeat protein [Bacillus paralicheniformis]|uniref:response regulator aspartate phosphatase n=1 Tax=Bacillus paralicheniformis TaxID=1648923 RepID=UPI002E2137A8|nr:tetratricopeptide repeat protein [Bacillus paralicheniformis]